MHLIPTTTTAVASPADHSCHAVQLPNGQYTIVCD
jgi:hypothetical protein